MNPNLRRNVRSISFLAVAFAAGAGVFFATAPDARAAFTLQLSDSSTTVTVMDGGAGDHSGTTGKIGYSGSIGIFGINLSTGYSKPVLGSAAEPQLQLSSLDVSSSSTGGTLTIKLSDSGFTTTGATNWISSITGATSGSVGFQAYIGTDNQAFSTDIEVADIGSLSGLFDESTSTDVNIYAAPFSVTLVATITHGKGFLEATALVANVKDPEPGTPLPISEPAALALFGAGLLGLGLLMRLLAGRERRSGDIA